MSQELNKDVAQRLIENQKKIADLYSHIGMLASEWAMFEFKINEQIWAVAGINPVAGSCITAHIFTIQGRIKCLVSLMKLRGLKQKFIDDMNAFFTKMQGTSEKRNRAIHDPIITKMDGSESAQIEITAQGKPVMRARPIDTQSISALRNEVIDRMNEFMNCVEQIRIAHPILPPIPPPEFDPTKVIVAVQK